MGHMLRTDKPDRPNVQAHRVAAEADGDDGAPSTLAVYGYVDTNSVRPGWTVAPHDGIIRFHKTFLNGLYGRGAGSKTGALGLVISGVFGGGYSGGVMSRTIADGITMAGNEKDILYLALVRRAWEVANVL